MLGFFVTNAWFLSLGALLLLGSKVGQEPKDFASAIALSAGWIALLILLADETHNAWADLYSAAVSLQNLFPKVKQRWLIVALGAGVFPGGRFPGHHPVPELPLPHRVLLRPLFGLLTADFYVLKRKAYRVKEFYRARGAYWFTRGVNVRATIAWAAGVAAYHLANPSTLGAIFPAWQKMVPATLGLAGGSLPSFAVAFLLTLVFGVSERSRRKRMEGLNEIR